MKRKLTSATMQQLLESADKQASYEFAYIKNFPDNLDCGNLITQAVNATNCAWAFNNTAASDAFVIKPAQF